MKIFKWVLIGSGVSNLYANSVHSQNTLASRIPSAALRNKEKSDFRPKSMGALGDSMTAGFLAHFNRKTSKLPWNQAWLLGQLATFGVTLNTKVLESPGLSWATGLEKNKRVKSHAERLMGLGLGSSRRVINEAISGDETQDLLLKQLSELNKESRYRFRTEYPDYVTVLIGANDACADSPEDMTDVGDFYARFYMAMDEMLWNNSNTHILVSHLPNIEKLRTVAKDADVLGFDALGISKCQDLWEVTGLCPTLTTHEEPSIRQKVAQRVRDYNLAMTSVTKNLRSQYGDRIRVSERAYQAQFSADNLSLDCFHPNVSGQNILAHETWQDSWWASK